MNSCTTERFRACLARLPQEVRRQARDAYKQFADNPSHPSLRFKKLHTDQNVFSVRISLDYRALGVRDGDTLIWFWIGPHSDYERLLASL
jgi:mRNA-degrading endonuclease RelE of RelBE toxin-antitoxin system